MSIPQLDYRWAAGVAAMMAVLVAAYSGYWFFAATKTERIVSDLAAGEFPGYRIAHQGISTDGFPFSIRLRVDEPEFTTEDRRVRWAWQTAILELRPWNLRRYRLAVLGPHRVDIGHLQESRQYTIASDHAVVVAELSGNGGLSRAEVKLRDVNIAGESVRQAISVGGLEVQISLAGRTSDDHAEIASEMSLSAASLALPIHNAQPLGSEIRSLRVGLSLLGSIDRFDQTAVDVWRRQGGTLEIRWFQANWGALDLRAVGTAALDDQLRPLVALTADIRGFDEALDALSSMGLISKSAAATGRVALGLIATPSSGGASSVLTVPLRAQDGGLFLGPLKLARLPSFFR